MIRVKTVSVTIALDNGFTVKETISSKDFPLKDLTLDEAFKTALTTRSQIKDIVRQNFSVQSTLEEGIENTASNGAAPDGQQELPVVDQVA